jgi:K+-transporting ATPase ATPase C chain
MFSHLRVNLILLGLTLLLCSVLYPLILWVIGQTFFPHQAEGSLIDENGNAVTSAAKARGSRLIAQPFKGDEYFQPRPSSAGSNGYDASASGGSNLGASNPLLRSRVARQLGPMVKYADDPRNRRSKRGQPVAKDIEAWFQKQVRKDPEYVARWAEENSTLAEQWVKDNATVVAAFLKKKEDDVKSNSADASKEFWKRYGTHRATRGTWPTVEDKTEGGKPTKVLVPARDGSDVQGFFFDLWLQDNKNSVLQKVPADMVMSSGSGLDPHITLKNARYQLENRVADKQAQNILEADPTIASLLEDAKKEKDPVEKEAAGVAIALRKQRLRKIIEDKLGQPLEKRITAIVEKLLQEKKEAPLAGLAGVDLVNVLELNLAMNAAINKWLQEIQ